MNGRLSVTLFIVVCLYALICHSCEQNGNIGRRDSAMENAIIRIVELEIDSNFVDEYHALLKKEAAASVRLEPGVLCIYPMYEKHNPTQVQLLEIYADQDAYEAHLKTPHFLHYKKTTLSMVKDLKLIDMEAMDKEMMSMIFAKIQK